MGNYRHTPSFGGRLTLVGASECAELEIRPLVYHNFRVYSLHVSLIYHYKYVCRRENE